MALASLFQHSTFNGEGVDRNIVIAERSWECRLLIS